MLERSVKVFMLCLFAASFSCTSQENIKDAYIAEKALAASWSMVGRPYKYSGDTPEGFDCSGLVRYSYRTTGIDVPHHTYELKELTRPVALNEMRRGDLVFFKRNGKKYGHVGIYAGNHTFVHAPSRGKYVRMDSLQDPYWKEHFSEGRMFDETKLQELLQKKL